jgi:hypothetical protein
MRRPKRLVIFGWLRPNIGPEGRRGKTKYRRLAYEALQASGFLHGGDVVRVRVIALFERQARVVIRMTPLFDSYRTAFAQLVN